MIIDLHMHSYYSPDGRYSIPQLLDMFSKGDIAGLTDHETIAGWRDFAEEARNRGIKPVLGIEWFSVKCHILAYFLNDVPENFYGYMRERRATERSCMRVLYETFKRKYPLLEPYDEVLRLRAHPEKVLGLPALSEAVSNAAGIERLEAEDMVRVEKRKIPIGNRPMPFYPQEIIGKIIEWNAVPILAHPYRNFGGMAGRQNRADVERKVRELSMIGIKGVDVYSWNSNHEESDHLLGLCDELELLPVVGSDFHFQDKGLYPRQLATLDKHMLKKVEEWIKNGALNIC